MASSRCIDEVRARVGVKVRVRARVKVWVRVGARVRVRARVRAGFGARVVVAALTPLSPLLDTV